MARDKKSRVSGEFEEKFKGSEDRFQVRVPSTEGNEPNCCRPVQVSRRRAKFFFDCIHRVKVYIQLDAGQSQSVHTQVSVSKAPEQSERTRNNKELLTSISSVVFQQRELSRKA